MLENPCVKDGKDLAIVNFVILQSGNRHSLVHPAAVAAIFLAPLNVFGLSLDVVRSDSLRCPQQPHLSKNNDHPNLIHSMLIGLFWSHGEWQRRAVGVIHWTNQLKISDTPLAIDSDKDLWFRLCKD